MKQLSFSLLPRGFIVLPALASVVIVIEAFLITPMNTADPAYDIWDCRRYISLAQGAPERYTSEAPFCWRVLVPAVVRTLPLSPDRAFYLLTIASLMAGSVLFLLYCRAKGLTSNEIAAAICFFLFSRWITGYLLFDFALVDAEALVFILLILWLSEIKAPRAFLLSVLAVGMLCKEQVLIAGIYLAAKELRHEEKISARIAMGLLPVILPLAVLLLLHSTITPANDYSIVSELRNRFTAADPPGFLHYTGRQWAAFVYDFTLGTWGAIALLVIFFGKKILRRLGSSPESSSVLAVVALQPLVAWNLERLLIYAFPIIVPLCIEELRDLPSRNGIKSSAVLWFSAALQALIFLHFLLSSHGIATPSVRTFLLGTMIPLL